MEQASLMLLPSGLDRIEPGMRAAPTSAVRRYPCICHGRPLYFLSGFCRGSSVAEQGTHKPLVGSSNLPLGTLKENTPH